MGIKSSPHVNLDTLLRSGMYDFLIVDKLFQIMFDLLRMAQTEGVSGDNKGSLELLKEVMSLAAQTSLKGSARFFSGIVNPIDSHVKFIIFSAIDWREFYAERKILPVSTLI